MISAGNPLGVRVLPSSSRVQEEELARWGEGAEAPPPAAIVSWRTLLTRLAEAGPRRRRLDTIGAHLLLREVLARFEVAPGPAGEALQRVRHTRGFVPSLMGLIAACKRAGVGPAALYTHAERSQNALLGEVSRIYAAYQEALARGRAEGGGRVVVPLSDPADLASDAAHALEHAPAPLSGLPELQASPVLVVEDRLDLDVAEGRLLITLARRLAEAGGGVILLVPDLSGRPRLHGPWRQRLETALPPVLVGELPALYRERALPAREGSIGRVVEGLFRPAEEASAGEVEDDGRVRLFSAATPDAEAQEVVRRVRDLLDAGVAPEDIALTAPDWALSLDPLARALDEAGIRWSPPEAPRLSSSPVATKALEVLDLVAEGFPREALIAFLGGGGSGALVKLARALALPRALLEILPDVLRRSGVQREPRRGTPGESAGYTEHLEALARQASAARREAEAASIRALATALGELFTLLAPLTHKERLSRGAALLRQILGEVGLVPLADATRARRAPPEDDADDTPDEGEGRLSLLELKAQARDQAAAKELVGMLDGLGRTARLLGDPELGPAGLRQVVGEAMAATRLPLRGARGARVELIPLDQMAGRSFPHVFVMGLLSGALPSTPTPDPFLPDRERRLFETGPGEGAFLDTGEHRRSKEAASLLLAVATASEGLSLSWPRSDAEDRPLVPSPWVRDLSVALGGRAPEVLPASLIPPLDACRGPRALLRRLSLDLLGVEEEEAAPAPHDAGPSTLALARVHAEAEPTRWAELLHLADVEHERLRFFLDLSPADTRWAGQLSAPALGARLPSALAGGARAPLSAQHLETFATCGFKFFAQRVLRIDESEEQGEELDNRQAGNLLHSAVEALYRRLQAHTLLPVTPRTLEAAQRHVPPTLREVAETWNRTQPRSHTGLFTLRRDRVEVQLRALLNYEAALAEEAPPPVPVFFERPFGYRPDDDPLPALVIPSPEGDDAVYIRGAIDRVDRTAEGYRVVDYKSGRIGGLNARLKADALGQTELQLPLYAMALRQALPGAAVDAVYLSLRDVKLSRTLAQGIPLLEGAPDADALLGVDPEARRQARARGITPIADRVWQGVEAMRAGAFLVRPTDCKLCRYGAACRILRLATPEDDDDGGTPSGG